MLRLEDEVRAQALDDVLGHRHPAHENNPAHEVAVRSLRSLNERERHQMIQYQNEMAIAINYKRFLPYSFTKVS